MFCDIEDGLGSLDNGFYLKIYMKLFETDQFAKKQISDTTSKWLKQTIRYVLHCP